MKRFDNLSIDWTTEDTTPESTVYIFERMADRHRLQKNRNQTP